MTEDEPFDASPKEKAYPITRIRATESLFAVHLRELWIYRELLYFFTWRDIKVRYRQTVIGVSWVLLQPLAMMLVFTVFFSRLAKMPSEGVPYPLYVYSALIPWQLFSKTITEAGNSMILNQRLVGKVFFPRILLPTAAGIGALVDFSASLVLLLLLMLFYGVTPGFGFFFLPLFILLTVLSGLGIGFWCSALNTQYRDIMYLIPFFNQIWMFITPVVYPGSLVPAQWKLLYALNPLVGVMNGFRWCLFGVGDAFSFAFWFSAVVSLLLFVSGVIGFRKLERTFPDYLA